jgi:phospholipase A1
MNHLWYPPRRAARLVALLGIAAAIMAPVPASAAPSIADCAAIAADAERLACYDRAAGRTAAPGPGTGPIQTESRTAAPMTAPAAPMTAPGAPGTAQAQVETPTSLLSAVWSFDAASPRYRIGLYRPNYLQVASYSTQPNDGPFKALFDAFEQEDAELDSTEAEFQISFKARLWATDDRRLGVWAAYTQESQWQVYNDELSRPFRETNYEPELFVSYDPDLSLGGLRWGLLNFGYNHQSNGRSDPISRSWDRLVAELGFEHGDFALLIRPWIVIDDGGDDNPDITDYYGYGDITGVYKWRDHSFSLMGRGNLDTGKGAVRLTWTTPPLLGPLRGYVDAFAGYGESMIDYDWYQNTIGIGIALNGLLDRP